VLVAVGDRQVRPGEPVALRDGDVVALLPHIGGG
jgi:molybdopterin converting factor small subunit